MPKTTMGVDRLPDGQLLPHCTLCPDWQPGDAKGHVAAVGLLNAHMRRAHPDWVKDAREKLPPAPVKHRGRRRRR